MFFSDGTGTPAEIGKSLANGLVSLQKHPFDNVSVPAVVLPHLMPHRTSPWAQRLLSPDFEDDDVMPRVVWTEPIIKVDVAVCRIGDASMTSQQQVSR